MAWITVVWFRDQNGWQNMQWWFELDKLYINFTSIFKKWFLQTWKILVFFLFKKTIQHFILFPKLIKEMLIFWNSIFSKSS